MEKEIKLLDMFTEVLDKYRASQTDVLIECYGEIGAKTEIKKLEIECEELYENFEAVINEEDEYGF